MHNMCAYMHVQVPSEARGRVEFSGNYIKSSAGATHALNR